MGVAMPRSSSVMANEAEVSEFRVMSAAQMLAMQVGEVAGIQVLETVQQALVRHRGPGHAPPKRAACHVRALFFIGSNVVGLGRVSALFIRSVPRIRDYAAWTLSRRVYCGPIRLYCYDRQHHARV